MAIRTFFDFVSARGENVIEAWLAAIPWQARDEINVQLLLLRNVQNLNRPAVGHLQGSECRGLIEIRVTSERQRYRPLAYVGPEAGQVTLLVGAKEKGDKLEPKDACATAWRRIDDIRSGRGTIHEHRFRSK